MLSLSGRRKLKLGVEGGCVIVVSGSGAEEGERSSTTDAARSTSRDCASSMWWARIDQDMETCVKKCTTCQSPQKDLPVAPAHPWSCPDRSESTLIMQSPWKGKCFCRSRTYI